MSQKENASSKPATEDTAAKPKPENSSKKHQDELLDEALLESFPASDPPSITIEE